MSFNLAAFDGDVTAVAFTPTGYLYVAGQFTTYDGDAVDALVRLQPDGTLDTDFDCGLENGTVYYPPTQLYVTADGGVVAGLSTNRLCILKGGGLNDRLRISGVNVPPIVKFFSNGETDGDWQTGLSVGSIVKAFSPIGAQRVAYVLKEGANTRVKLVRTNNLEIYDLLDTGSGAFNDVVAVDRNRLVVVSGVLSGQVTQTAPEAKTFTTAEWPLSQGIMAVDLTLTPVPFWVSSAGVVDKGCFAGLYSAEWTRLYVGQLLTVNGSFGQWCGSNIEQHRGMIASGLDFVSGASSEWDLRTEDPVVTSNKQGFEPYTNTSDDDSFVVAARPLAIKPSTGSVFITAPFAKLKDVAVTKYYVKEIGRDGVVGAFALPTLTSSGIPRVLCAALSPNEDVLVIGGRIDNGIMAVDGSTGAVTTNDVVTDVPHTLKLGGGVRSLEWVGFGENLYFNQTAQ